VEDHYRLERFVEAQDYAATYDRAVAELRGGRKTSHWMWFVFPQLAGLGQSQMSRTYAISGLGEARAYLSHAVLGPRLVECARLVADAAASSTEEIFGGIDSLKLRSCMTLFMRATPREPVFKQVLERYFGGATDPATDRQLGV
jgi:uncharacterized protein (DUF1810 family)